MSHKFSVTRGLVQLKRLEQRINKKIDILEEFVVANKVSSTKVKDGLYTKDQFTAKAKSEWDSLNDLISLRKEIKERSRIGDWEGDTVYGAVGKGLVVTLADRKTRYLLAGKLENRNSTLTEKVIIKLLKNKPVESLSLDNGSEFANFKRIEEQISAPIYFAEPHKPWQRGTNENTNDILRFFYPKGTNFNEVSDEELEYVVYLINTRPRKCLNWKSPFEVFWGVALA